MKSTLKSSIKELVFHYLEEAVHNPLSHQSEELYGMADNFVEDLDRYLGAYRDFKEVKTDAD